MSSGSSCYLPPPPPYRFRSGTSGSDGLSESASTPKLITLSAGAIKIGGGALPAELFSMINTNEDAFPNTSRFDQQTFPQLVAYQQQQFNGHISQQSSDFPTDNNDRRINTQSVHRIHRSLSDSKYGQNELSQRMGRLLKSDSQNSAVISNMAAVGTSLQHQVSNKIGNSDPYVGNRGSSWNNSQMSLVSFMYEL